MRYTIGNDLNRERGEMVCGDIVRYNTVLTAFPGGSAAESQRGSKLPMVICIHLRLTYKPTVYTLTELEHCTIKGKNDTTMYTESLAVEANDLSRGKWPALNYSQSRIS